MAWPHYRETVSVVDVLESGACPEGVKEHLERRPAIVGRADSHLGNKYIQAAAFADGSGYGYGYGDG